MLKKILTVIVMLYTALAMAAVDVNKASEAELDGVKGIGPVTSKLIMSERKKGEFKDWNDFITRVKGLGESRAAKLSGDGLTVNGSAYKAAAAGRDARKDDKTAVKEDKKAARDETKSARKETKAEAKAEVKAGAADSKTAAKPTASATPAVAAAPAKPAASAAKK